MCHKINQKHIDKMAVFVYNTGDVTDLDHYLRQAIKLKDEVNAEIYKKAIEMRGELKGTSEKLEL